MKRNARLRLLHILCPALSISNASLIFGEEEEKTVWWNGPWQHSEGNLKFIIQTLQSKIGLWQSCSSASVKRKHEMKLKWNLKQSFQKQKVYWSKRKYGPAFTNGIQETHYWQPQARLKPKPCMGGFILTLR